MSDQGEFVAIAKIVRTRGIRGEVVAEILTEFPDRFRFLDRVHLSRLGFTGWEVLEHHWFQKNRVILRFKGRKTPHEVEALVGCEVQVPESERIELPDDTFFDSDLLGCQVIQGQDSLGLVVDVSKQTSASTSLLVRTPDNRDLMIPFVRKFVVLVDLVNRRIEVELPPGLMELAVKVSKGKDRRKN